MFLDTKAKHIHKALNLRDWRDILAPVVSHRSAPDQHDQLTEWWAKKFFHGEKKNLIRHLDSLGIGQPPSAMAVDASAIQDYLARKAWNKIWQTTAHANIEALLAD